MPGYSIPGDVYVTRRIQRRPGDPDPAVIEACRGGDRGALDAVFREQTPALERLLARLVGPGADLEDLLQSTLMSAVSAFPRYRGEASVRTWLARIAVNEVRQHLRRPERRRRATLELVPDDRAAPEEPPDRATDQRRQLARLFTHLDKIGPKKRLAFVLTTIEGCSIEEAAALTGASVAATKSRVYWARRALLGRARKDPVLRDLLGDES
jgi:RNA polymerase sigma-70 factor, ECF subfamily